MRVLDKLNYTEIARHPKLLIGFSDITALHTALGEKSGIVTVHGPMLGSLASSNLTAYTEREFFRGIAADEPLGASPPRFFRQRKNICRTKPSAEANDSPHRARTPKRMEA